MNKKELLIIQGALRILPPMHSKEYAALLKECFDILDAALAAPEQQPRAWMRKWAFDGDKPYKEKNANGRMAWPIRFKMRAVTKDKHFDDDVALYTAPAPAPQREWVSLTDEEIEERWILSASREDFGHSLCAALRAKNEEKNHG